MERWVSIDRCAPEAEVPDIYECVKAILSAGMDTLAVEGKKILVKPNYCGRFSYKSGVVTNPKLLAALTRIFLEMGAERITIAEGSGLPLTETKSAFTMNRLYDLESDNVSIVDMKTGPFYRVSVHGNEGRFQEISVSTLVGEADFLVNLPIMKTHALTGVTLGFKNLKGVLSDEEKVRFHRDGLVQGLVALNKAVKPHLVILDGLIGLEGNGPLHGMAANLGILIASNDPAVAEIVGARVMGFDPMDLDYLCESLSSGLITEDAVHLSDVRCFGRKIEEVTRKVQRPHLPEFERYKIRCVTKDACSSCLALLTILFSDPVLARLYKGATVLAGDVSPDEVGKISESKVIVFGDCQLMNKERGLFIPGCPPDYIESQDKLLQPLKRLSKR